MGTLPNIDPTVALRIADVVRHHEYTEQNVVATLGAPTAPVAGVARLGSMMQRTAGGRPIDTLIRLFIVGNRFDESVLAELVAPTTVDDWCAIGILERVEGQVRAALSVRAFGGLLLVGDIARRPDHTGLSDDYVMGMSPSTQGLAGLTVRRPSGATLDLGAGGGYHALRAALHSDRVVATDLNPRAVWMANLNVALNGIDGIDVRQGDLFAPVEGETFDLIVSNPPFIIGPDISQQFLSTEREGDGLCRELAREAPRYLNEGGYCQFLANWISVAGEPWWDRIGAWFAGSGCDVWAIRISSEPPDQYATTWISSMTDDVDEFEARFARWMTYYDSVGADGIGFGLVTMHKRSTGVTWARFDDLPDAFSTGSGEDLDRLVELQTWASGSDIEEVLDARFVVAPEARAVQQLVWADGGWATESLSFRRVSGLRFGGSIDAGAMELLAGFDGTRTLRAVIAGVVAADALESAHENIADSVRQLVTRGLLLPVR